MLFSTLISYIFTKISIIFFFFSQFTYTAHLWLYRRGTTRIYNVANMDQLNSSKEEKSWLENRSKRKKKKSVQMARFFFTSTRFLQGGTQPFQGEGEDSPSFLWCFLLSRTWWYIVRLCKRVGVKAWSCFFIWLRSEEARRVWTMAKKRGWGRKQTKKQRV